MSSFEDQAAQTPPKGATSNFENPKNRNREIFAVVGLCISINTIFVFARTYTRLFLIKRRGWQDYLLLTSWLFSVAYLIMLPIGIHYGAGLHQWDITIAQLTIFSRRANIAAIFYSPVMCLIKLAILFQLASLFAPVKSRMYWVICTLSTLTIMFYLACMIFRILQCIPREKIWNPSVPGTCINSTAGILSSAIVNTISDFLLLVLPLDTIWRLQMPQSKKWQVSAVFATGLFGCICSIMRLVASIDLINNGDATYMLTTVSLWCDAEITSAIVCCCLPVLPQFYRKHVSSVVSSVRSRLRSSTAGPSTYVGGFSPRASAMVGATGKMPGHILQTKETYLELKESVSKDSENLKGSGAIPRGW